MTTVNKDNETIFIKKLQAIYLMLYKQYKTAKIKKYKHEHVLAYTYNLSSVARSVASALCSCLYFFIFAVLYRLYNFK